MALTEELSFEELKEIYKSLVIEHNDLVEEHEILREDTVKILSFLITQCDIIYFLTHNKIPEGDEKLKPCSCLLLVNDHTRKLNHMRNNWLAFVNAVINKQTIPEIPAEYVEVIR